MSRRAPAGEQGATLGVNQSFASLGRMLGPAFGGFLYQHFDPRTPYVAAAIGMALGLLVAVSLPATGLQPAKPNDEDAPAPMPMESEAP